MLFDAKLSELSQYLDHLDAEWSRVGSSAHPNLADRLQHRLVLIADLKTEFANVAADIRRYQPSSDPALDTWPQVFQRLRDLTDAVHGLRLKELPAYLARTPDDHYVSILLEAMHVEVGLTAVNPVASLHQSYWFAVLSAPPSHPLYFVPSSYEVSPLEMALLYHEMGHLLYRLWSPAFSATIDRFIASHLQKKTQEANGFTQPKVREAALRILDWWRDRYQNEMEETACDVVGALLGGPAFATALTMGLMALRRSPFALVDSTYPPLDCRMRLPLAALRARGLADASVDRAEMTWKRVAEFYARDKGRWYDWLYDHDYLQGLVRVVEQFLVMKKMALYDGQAHALIRGGLNDGAAVLDNLHAFDSWRAAFVAHLRRDYSP